MATTSKTQKTIIVRLKSLVEIGNVTVEVTEGLGRIDIKHKRDHVANFQFNWLDDSHYTGYFVDGKGKKSQAIVSLWTPMEAAKFMVAYSMFVELGAKRPDPTLPL